MRSTRRIKRVWLVAATTLAVVAAMLLAAGIEQRDAFAKRTPAKVFRGQILLSNKRFASSAKSVAAYIKKIKKNKKTKFSEDKKSQSWKIYLAAFFRKPLNDLEVTVKLYDVTTGRRHLVTSLQQFTSRRGQTSLTSDITLERKFFGVNKKILITMESRKTVLAQGTFHILGEAEKYSGKADFSDE